MGKEPLKLEYADPDVRREWGLRDELAEAYTITMRVLLGMLVAFGLIWILLMAASAD